LKHYPPHPAANIFPLNTDGPEFKAFAESIKARGLDHPIVLYEGKILDGRRRYLACQKAGVEPKFVDWDGKGSPVDYVFSANALRRHLTPGQLVVAVLKALPFYQKEAKDRQRLSKGRGQKGAQPCATLTGKATEWAANKVGVSPRMVEMAKKLQEVEPKLIAEIEAGRTTVNEAYEVAGAASSHPSGDTSEDDRFRTPQKLFDALNNEYQFRLDACAEKEVAKCENYFTPKQDALRQHWAQFGDVFCNPPFHRKHLAHWVVKGFLEAQKGATVVMLLPYYKSYDWFRYVVIPFAEIRQIQGNVIYSGYGNQKGKCAGNRGSRPFDSIVAVFRKGQRGFNGWYVDRAGQETPPPPKCLPRKFWKASPLSCGRVAKKKTTRCP